MKTSNQRRELLMFTRSQLGCGQSSRFAFADVISQANSPMQATAVSRWQCMLLCAL